jgi:circadian clock protein KaiB
MKRSQFMFRLYIARDAHNSVLALANLTAICEKHLNGRYRIEVVDVFKQPERALADRIFMTPTLVRVGPPPMRTIVGSLSHTQTVLDALRLESLA